MRVGLHRGRKIRMPENRLRGLWILAEFAELCDMGVAKRVPPHTRNFQSIARRMNDSLQDIIRPKGRAVPRRENEILIYCRLEARFPIQ